MSEPPADMTPPPAPGPGSQTPGSQTPTNHDGDYIVVARRYRPQAFDELIGQGHVAKALKQAIASGRIGHAYLFTGARGVGKTSAARIFAKALNCTASAVPTPTPCNDCDVCRSVSTGDDVDVLEIDGASNRGIDEIRQLRQNAGVRPSRARMKVYIIDEVHMLTKEAFNALLKTLEEPPEHVKFVFATTEPNNIPITILSRCQRFDFAGIEATSIQQRLAQIAEAEGVGIDAEALQILAMRAAGSMRDSQSLLEQLLAVAEHQITGDDVNALLGIAPAARVVSLAERLADRNAAGALTELDAALSGGADAGQLIDQLMGCYRDVMALAVGCPAEQVRNALPTQADALRTLADRLGVQTLLAVLQVLDQTAARMRLSVHGRTLAEMAVVRISQLEDLDGLADVIAALREGAPLPAREPAAPSPRSAPSAAPKPPAALGSAGPTPATTPASSTAAPSTDTAPGLADQLAKRVADKPVPAASPAPAPSPPPAPPVSRSPVPPPADPHASAGNGSNGAAADDGPSLTDMLNAKLQAGGDAGSPPAPKLSRRQLESEAAQQPFVKKAMELFDVEPGKLRYSPPKTEG